MTSTVDTTPRASDRPVPLPEPPHQEHARHLLGRLGLAALAFAIIAGAVYVWRHVILDPSVIVTDDAYTRADVTPMSAKIEGYVQLVAVEDNQHVKKGDLLVSIRTDDYEAQVAQAQANVEVSDAAIANIDNLRSLQQALIKQAEATIVATQADVTRFKLEADRQRQLVATNIAGTKQTYEQAIANEQRIVANLELNRAQLLQQQRQLAVYDTQQRQIEAQRKASQAVLDLARINLNYTQILAPADGTVGERTVKAGQLVRDGTQVITLVPSESLWVVANFKETQLTDVRPGDPVRVTVDTYPDVELKGHVDSLSPASGAQFALIPPDNSTGNFTKIVQRVPVKIVLDPEPKLAGLLRPGLSVTARISPVKH